MKKTIFTSFIATLLITLPAYAQIGGDLTASATKPTVTVQKETTVDSTTTVELKKPKIEPLAVRKQKIEADLRATISKLQIVIDRTQVFIDLLSKNGKDTAIAQEMLLKSKVSLKDATDALEQFSGVVIPEIKIDAKAKLDDKITSTISVKETPAPASLKDPLKKVEESLKESKVSLIASINALKEILNPKEEPAQ